jgi:hypothetical protein
MPSARGSSPEFHELVVSDIANAVTMLENCLPTNPRYNWNTASCAGVNVGVEIEKWVELC